MSFEINTKTPLYPPEVIDEVRQFDLEEVAQRLGMKRDRFDKKKWRITGCAISIDPSRGVFFDHLAQTGGGGAISLVTHVMQCDFVTAMDFLWGKPVDFPFRRSDKVVPAKVKVPEKPARCNRRDRQKWQDVKNYLIDHRGLPTFLIDSLHRQGLIDADSRSNAMFFRYAIASNFQLGEAVGASLRSTSGDLKLLTPGTKRNEGWFFFGIGEGIVYRIFLVESPIDAISLAALRGDSIYGRTIYISIDGAGSIPITVLTNAVQQGAKIILALDGDRPGEEMSWRIAKQLQSSLRVRPLAGKDWNEQLLGSKPYLPIKEEWFRFAIALGKDELTQQRIEHMVEQTILSTAEKKMLRFDWIAFRRRQDRLWQWYRQAEIARKSPEYLQRIVEIAIAFNQQQPVPLSKKAIETMQKDLFNQSYCVVGKN
ncbi:toprim domain-containing protein [Pleurocapsa sp. PCC 7319]|uniref:toprim domain-containing protein n=1 Tax=Pleurocapsa sp. PCC 7319 TaxID=118161 RepID=UPI00034C6D91|nr:toprim domain-containing protein [Pleurocapsa sp. PCC 7319]